MRKTFRSVFGPLTLTFDQNKISSLTFEDCGVAASDESEIEKIFNSWLKNYEVGSREPFAWDYFDLQRVSDFQKKVYQALWAIPFGQTLTYAGIAQNIAKPKACRAVGNANGHNQIPLLIPCHRVVASVGLGGYSGGLDLKQKILQHEGAL